MRCTFCDTPVSDGAVYCQQCGSLVSDAEGQAAATGTLNDSAIRHLTELLREDAAGEFEIGRQLGRGGMAVVFLAREVKLDREVAIKVLPPELTFGHGVERFMREAKTAAKLDHPNIIPIHRISDGGKIFWYAMKYLDGQSLDQRLTGAGLMSVAETVSLLTPVADALDYAHEQHVIHRDIKPANVMFDSRGRVIVTDFGIAKALTEGTLTASGSVIGTPYFMSPEQGMGKVVGGASDQYSVAVVTYRMLSGHLPFEGNSAVDILHKHCTAPPAPLKELRPGLPEHTYNAISKALAKNPERRFSSVMAFVNALKEPSDEITTSDLQTLPMDTPPSEQSRISTQLLSRAEGPVGDRPQAESATSANRPGRRLKQVLGLILLIAVVGTGTWSVVEFWPSAVTTVQEDPTEEAAGAGGQPEAGAEPAAGDSTDTDAEVLPTTPPVAEVDQPPPQPMTGRVTINGVPAGGLVLVDQSVRGGASFDLSPGIHVVRVEVAGNRPFEEVVNVSAGASLSVAYVGVSAPPGFLQLSVRPWAHVEINGRRFEEVVVRLDTLPPREYSIHLENPALGSALDTTVVVRSGDTTRVQIRMTGRDR